MSHLKAAFASVKRSSGQILLVSGAAVVGKSAVIDAFVRNISGTATCAVGYGDPLSTPWTLGPVREIARRILQLPILLICSCRDDEVDADHPLHASLGAIPVRVVKRIPRKPLRIDGPGSVPASIGDAVAYRMSTLTA